MQSKPERTFIFVCSGLTLLAIFLTVLFNYLVDPFDYFKGPFSLVESDNKYINGNFERFDKAIRIIQKKPQAIILGTSRVRTGFKSSDASEVLNVPVFKAAFSGATFDEMYGYFEHALYNQPDLKVVILGLDYFAFLDSKPPHSDYSEERLRKTHLPISDIFKLLLSWNMLEYSYQTYQHHLNPAKLEKTTTAHFKLDEHEYIDLNSEIIENPHEHYLKVQKFHLFDKHQIDPKKLGLLRKMVDICKERNIDLKLFYCPAHALYWETIYQSKKWEDFEKLKRAVADMHPAYDFSGYSKLNTEPLGTPSSQFYEVSHFKHIFGRMMLDKMYGIVDRCPETGCLLTNESVEAHLKSQRQERDLWAKQHPEEVIKLKEYLESE